jgi:hypothetical protein
MSDIQDSILRLNFSQALPKSIIDKLSSHDLNRDGKIKGGGGKSAGKSEQGDSDKQDLVYDNDKKHVSWCLKDNENFMTMFYKNQKDCPKTFEGRHLCMKFFIRGLCTKSCPRSHHLSKEDEKKIETYLFSTAGSKQVNWIFSEG